jgi:hypothetical protein
MSVKKGLAFCVLLVMCCAMQAAQAKAGQVERKLTCEPQFPVVGQKVTFIALNFRTPNLLRWEMGDGMVLISGSTSSQARESKLTYTYPVAGIFEVKVYDDNGNIHSNPLTLLVWVKAGPEKAAGGPDKSVPVPLPPKVEPVEPERAVPAPDLPVAVAAKPDEHETVAPGPVPVTVKKNPLIKIGPSGGLYLPQNDILKTVYGTANMIYGGRLGLRVWGGIYFWISAARFKAVGKTTLSEDQTTLTLTPFSAFLRLGFSLGDLKPYAGVGYTYMNFKEESVIGDTEGNGRNFSLEAGIEYKMSRNFFLDFNARFDQIKVNPGGLEEKIDLGGLQAGVALLLSF